MMNEHHGIRYHDIDHPHYKYELDRQYSMHSGLSLPLITDSDEHFRLGMLGTDLQDRLSIYFVGNRYVSLSRSGLLTLVEGYAWDGPSGPTFDTPSFMRGSLIHDGFYQLLREGWFLDNHDLVRKVADQLLYTACREDGMSWLRAKLVYFALRAFASGAAK